MSEINYFNDLKESLEDAIAFKNGNKSRCRTTVREIPIPEYSSDDITHIRSELALSQRGLAAILGVSHRTVEAWEAGRNKPNGAARHLLYLIGEDNSLVNRLIAK